MRVSVINTSKDNLFYVIANNVTIDITSNVRSTTKYSSIKWVRWQNKPMRQFVCNMNARTSSSKYDNFLYKRNIHSPNIAPEYASCGINENIIYDVSPLLRKLLSDQYSTCVCNMCPLPLNVTNMYNVYGSRKKENYTNQSSNTSFKTHRYLSPLSLHSG